MRIDVLPVTGSPRGVIPSTIYERGVGGSEKFIMELMKILSKNGHTVNFYNDPIEQGVYDGVNYFPNFQFPLDVEDRILITFRGYDERVASSKYKKHVGISTDQYTNEWDYARYWYPSVSEMVGISEFHKADHISRYGKIAEMMKVIDIGCDTSEYYNPLIETTIKKVPYQCLFSSVPDRGLNYMYTIWPHIKNKYKDAKLIITSDYRLWGSDAPNNIEYRLKFAGMDGIEFLGKVTRKELIELQKSSEALLYPCSYDENFCMSVQESIVAGCYPITSNKGAIETTNTTLGKIDSNPSDPEFIDKFINRVFWFFDMPIEDRLNLQKDCYYIGEKRFSWTNIIQKWNEVLKIE